MSREHIGQTSAWLYRLSDGLDDALADARANAEGNITYLGFDFSFLYPNVVTGKTLSPTIPKHRYDLASRYIYNNIDLYRSEIFGYKFVFNDLCLLKLLHNATFHVDSIDSIISSNDIYSAVKQYSSQPLFNGDAPTADALAQVVAELIDESNAMADRLRVLKRHLETKTIVGSGDIFDRELLRRSWSDRESFDAAYSIVDQYRYPTERSPDVADQRFLKTVDTISLVSTKHLRENGEIRYRFLGWTRGRGFFGPKASRYYRLVLSPFYRLVTLRETPAADDLLDSSLISLEDRKEQARLYHRRALSLYNNGKEELSSIFTDSISLLRDDYIRHLAGETMSMDAERRQKLAESLRGNAREARAALSEASDNQRTALLTLAELAADFEADELLSMYELHHNPRMKKLFHDLKLGS